MNIDNLANELDNATTINSLSNSFSKITAALNQACNSFYKQLFDYKFSTYLYKEYILLNKTKLEIADELKLSPSTVYYYIKKYKLKKDRRLTNANIVESLRKTCNERYNVNHPGELPEAHRKRIDNILIKTNGNYSKHFYNKLNRSEDTINRMKISQQNRRHREKLEGNNDE